MKQNFLVIFKKNLQKYYLIYILIILILFFSFLVIRDIHKNQKGKLQIQQKSFKEFFQNHKKPISDVEYIENWMTFKYINSIFNVPENYIKDKLNINDKRYPNIPLWRYFKSNDIDSIVWLKQIKIILREYLVLNPLITK